jgi:hypothetical protein
MKRARQNRKPAEAVRPARPPEPVAPLAGTGRLSDTGIVIGLTVVAFLLRIVRLGGSELWGDEILFVQKSSPPLSPWKVAYDFWNNFLYHTHLSLIPFLQNIYLWIVKWVQQSTPS